VSAFVALASTSVPSRCKTDPLPYWRYENREFRAPQAHKLFEMLLDTLDGPVLNDSPTSNRTHIVDPSDG